jgi:hypothetical protein
MTTYKSKSRCLTNYRPLDPTFKTGSDIKAPLFLDFEEAITGSFKRMNLER